jgi:hypothetical protein
MATKTGEAIERSRLKWFAENLLEIWTRAEEPASHESFFSNKGHFPTEAAHFSAFASIAHEEATFMEMSLRERFPKNDLLVKCCMAAVAASICRVILADSVK